MFKGKWNKETQTKTWIYTKPFKKGHSLSSKGKNKTVWIPNEASGIWKFSVFWGELTSQSIIIPRIFSKSSSWWFQRIWKTWVKMGSSSPSFGMKIENIFSTTTQSSKINTRLERHQHDSWFPSQYTFGILATGRTHKKSSKSLRFLLEKKTHAEN